MDKCSISKPLSIFQRDYIENSNNINISKLSENFLNINSALSKNSIASSSNGFGSNLIHLSCNSNSNFFLNNKALIEQKHGMFASAELTQGIDNGSHSNYMGDDHQRSNSSLPMFSPLKESDLFQSKKITPRTHFNCNNNNIHNKENNNMYHNFSKQTQS